MCLLYFHPFVAEGNSAVKNKFARFAREARLAGFAVGVSAEVAQSLELITGTGFGILQGGFDKTIFQNLKRIRVEVDGEILPFGNVVGIFFCEKVVIQADFSLYGVFC